MDGVSEPGEPGGVRIQESDLAERETADLLDAIRRGDPAAFETVAREHAPGLFRLALRLCGNRDDAEDLVQETLVRALPALRRFEGRAKLSTYLARALGNLWKNRLRSKSRSRLVDWFAGRRREDETAPEPDVVDPAPSALERMESADLGERVRAAVQRLEPARRWVLLLREVEELSYEEIAETIGAPVGTVRSRLARARADLRALLGEGP